MPNPNKPTRTLTSTGWVALLKELAPKLEKMKVSAGPNAGDPIEIRHEQSCIDIRVGHFKALVTLAFPSHVYEYETMFPAYKILNCDLMGSLQLAENTIGLVEHLIEVLRFVREETKDVQVTLVKDGTP